MFNDLYHFFLDFVYVIQIYKVYAQREGVGNCFDLRAASWSRKLTKGRTF